MEEVLLLGVRNKMLKMASKSFIHALLLFLGLFLQISRCPKGTLVVLKGLAEMFGRYLLLRTVILQKKVVECHCRRCLRF